MGTLILSATFLLLVVFSPTFAEIDCERDVHETCPSLSLFQTVSDTSGLSEAFLEQRCSDILEDVSCKDEYLRTCDRDNYALYSLLTDGVRNLFTELCNETSDLRIGFRKNIECLQSKSSKLRTCIFIAMESAQRGISLYVPGHYNSELQQLGRLCKFQESFRSCSVTAATNYCGKEAGKYLFSVYEITVQNLVTQVCQSEPTS